MSAEARSRVMRAVRSKWTGQERLFASLCAGWERGGPSERNADFVFRASKVAVFLDGDFWHGRYDAARLPERWQAKLSRTRERDASNRAWLESQGWEVVAIWEGDFLSDPAGWVDEVKARVESREEGARLWNA